MAQQITVPHPNGPDHPDLTVYIGGERPLESMVSVIFIWEDREVRCRPKTYGVVGPAPEGAVVGRWSEEWNS